MDNERILRMIEKLMKQRGYTRYKLSKLSGISQSTLTTMFNKRSVISLGNLWRVCNALDLRMSSFFKMLEAEPRVDGAEDFPVALWESLSEEKRRLFVTMISAAVELEKKREN